MRVDRDAGVIRGVKILGLHSRNGRQYPAETLAKAAPLYEEAKVNVNHPKGSPLAPRDYQERIGVIRGVEVRAGEGLFGDLHFNPKHLLAEQLIWDAEHAPENVGFSHNVQARTARRDELLVVEEITRVQGVDLVADPATTRGLYEQGRSPAADGDSLNTLTLEQLRAAAPTWLKLYCASSADVGRLRGSSRPRSRCRTAAPADGAGAAEVGTVGGNSRPQHRGRTDRGRHSQPDGHRFVPAATSSGCHGRRPAAIDSRTLAGGPRSGAGRPTSRDQQLVESANLPWLPVDSKGFARRISA